MNTNKKTFCFRFDVDTHRCIRRGVPNLLSLFDELDVRATFFVNPGRAVSLWQFLKSVTRKPSSGSDIAKLSSFSKMGLRDTMIAVLLNPQVGSGHPDRVRRIKEAGHEVAVHGGTNHAEWMYNVHNWSQDQLRNELLNGRARLENILGETLHGFGSPGWNGPDALPGHLSALGFDYMADRHGSNEESVVRTRIGPTSIPTNILGEPGGVGFLESLRAQGFSNSDILNRFRTELRNKKHIATFFEHPFYAGLQELDLLREIVSIVRNQGFVIKRYEELIERPIDSAN